MYRDGEPRESIICRRSCTEYKRPVFGFKPQRSSFGSVMIYDPSTVALTYPDDPSLDYPSVSSMSSAHRRLPATMSALAMYRTRKVSSSPSIHLQALKRGNASVWCWIALSQVASQQPAEPAINRVK